MTSLECFIPVLWITAMKRFEFSSENDVAASPIFDGDHFYNVYKDAIFLRQRENIETILSKGYELRIMLRKVKPGQMVAVSGMVIGKHCPLLVKKTGPNVKLGNLQFTANRLSGLVAAYAFDNRNSLPALKSSEALALGLTWDNTDENKCKLFLSSVSGTEHFVQQFQFWPLVCGLRKLQLKTITVEPVLKMAKIKTPDGSRMANQLMRNLATVKELWAYFPGESSVNLKNHLKSLPPEMKTVFYNNK